MKKILFIISIIISSHCYAATATITITATFKALNHLAITQVTAPDFGYLKAGVGASTYVLSTGGVVTASGAGGLEGGSPAAGNYTISGSGSQMINIIDSGYTASVGVTPSSATCKYGSGAPTSCTQSGLAAPTMGGTPLLVGMTINTSTPISDNTIASPFFILTVVYQ